MTAPAVLWDVGRNRCLRRGTSVIGISAEEIRSRRKPAVPDAASGINHGTLPIGLRKQEHYFLPRGVPLAVNPARSSGRLSPGKDQKWDRLLNRKEEVLTDRLYCIRFMEKKAANMEVIAENTLRNSYEKRLKIIKFDSFYMLFGNVAMTNCCMCRGECTRKHQHHPERQNDYASHRDSNIKVIHWFKMNLQQYVKTFLLKGDRCAEESAGIFI